MSKTNAYFEMQCKHQEEFDKFPHFFAFSNEQFAKGMKELGLEPNQVDSVKSYFGAGDYYRKKDISSLQQMFLRQAQERKAAIAADTDGTGFIQDMFSYELANHEYSYTQDLTETLTCLGLTINDINSNSALCNGLALAIEAQCT